MVFITDFNGIMMLTISQPLALTPYLLRSLRIKRMFEAREIYHDQDKMPKNMIWKWREKRVILIFLICLFTYAVIALIVQFLNEGKCYENDQSFCYQWPTFNLLKQPVHNKGRFNERNFRKSQNSGNSILLLGTFIEYIMLMWAIYSQWQIEKEYSIHYEILIIGIVWSFCSI